MDYQSALINLKPRHEFFIAIDSDGCVFDTMEVKQKEFFIPNALKQFNLFSISKIVRETWELVNLYSVYRGGNRYTSLIKVLELLGEKEAVRNTGISLPDVTSLKKWVKGETKLGTGSLRAYLESNYDPDLEKILKWSEAVNEDISEWLREIPPFPQAKKAIPAISLIADIIIASQTPMEAIIREWEEHDLIKYVTAVAALEHGTKTEHIRLAAKGRYPDNKILMIGDAIGDLEAAKNNGILFYPVIPGNEDNSWKRFLDESLPMFINGAYKGEYENSLISEFKMVLPDISQKKK